LPEVVAIAATMERFSLPPNGGFRRREEVSQIPRVKPIIQQIWIKNTRKVEDFLALLPKLWDRNEVELAFTRCRRSSDALE